MIQQSLLDLKARRLSNEKQLKDMEAQAKENSAGSEESSEEIVKLRKEIDELEQYKIKLQEDLSRMDGERTELNKVCADINEKRIREEANLERIDIDMSNLSVRIKEDYDLDYDTAKQFASANPFEGEFEPNKAQQESLSLRRKIERLGPVNELAEQKFINEKGRFDDLSRQYDDLVKAEAELKKIIADLTVEMTEKFAKSFAQINLNFQEVFKELFGGGSARLELEKEEGVSVLDAGIEIMAEPPGKKLTRISLLSGGERALTAIAILFAIIKLNPMPFSILDEIEAALDEANASLFAQYLHKFSRSTQFIVVTHRKPTMELADMLYGVTMQEKGISKLVSAKLEDAIKEIKGA